MSKLSLFLKGNESDLKRVVKAMNDFCKKHYGYEKNEFEVNEGLLKEPIGIATSTDIDCEKNEYTINVTIDLLNCIELHEIINDEVTVLVAIEFTYDKLINDLNDAPIESWVSINEYIDMEDLALVIKNQLEIKELNNWLAEAKDIPSKRKQIKDLHQMNEKLVHSDDYIVKIKKR